MRRLSLNRPLIRPQGTAMAVGQNVLRKEGFEKLTGAARYVDDIMLEGMLFGKTVRSSVPRGRIKAINFDPDYDWSRVVIADYRDIPGENYVALIENDQPLLAEIERARRTISRRLLPSPMCDPRKITAEQSRGMRLPKFSAD